MWNKEPKKIDIAFGIQKLQIGCVVEDDKVLTDDIFEKIEAWENDVQSVDMVSMQKLWFVESVLQHRKPLSIFTQFSSINHERYNENNQVNE